VCDIKYGLLFGGAGARVLQVHHRKQMALMDAPVLTRPDDLVVVCANCHSLIHADPRKARSVEAMRAAFRSEIPLRNRVQWPFPSPTGKRRRRG
jgi:predicted HNH restriction endonuclease